MSYSSLDNWIRKMYRDYQVELIYLQFEMSIFLKSISISTNYSLHTNYNSKLKILFYHLLPICSFGKSWAACQGNDASKGAHLSPVQLRGPLIAHLSPVQLRVTS